MSICYFYRMTSDTGFAPCVFEDNYKLSDMLSLACCKGGQVRKGTPVFTGLRHTIGKNHRAENGLCTEDVYVTGILDDRVLYCAKISKIPTMTEYFSNKEFANRMDQIYSVVNPVSNNENEKDKNSYLKSMIRNDKHLLFHGSKGFSSVEELENQNLRDKLGKYVLLSTSFSYYGKDAITIPDKIRGLMPKRQESKCYLDYNCIDAFVLDMVQASYHSSEPTERLTDRSCKGCRAK